MLYYAKSCPRCRTGMVVVDPGAHPADEGAKCLTCAWRPRPARPPPYSEGAAGPRPTHVEPYDPADEKPEYWHKQELRARQAQLAPLIAAGVGRDAAAAELGVSARTVSRWARVLEASGAPVRRAPARRMRA